MKVVVSEMISPEMSVSEKAKFARDLAEKHWKTIRTWDCWKSITIVERDFGGVVDIYETSEKKFIPQMIKLYKNKAEKDANRPILQIDCGMQCFVNRAYFCKLIKLIDEKLKK